MSNPEEVESKIPIIYHDYNEGIDFYFLDDFNKIGCKCPKCLSETDLENYKEMFKNVICLYNDLANLPKELSLLVKKLIIADKKTVIT